MRLVHTILPLVSFFASPLFSGRPSLSPGSAAPEFSLPGSDGAVHTLSAYRGRKVVLYFYPKDGTPGCTKEACSIRDNFSAIKEQGIAVFGISFDSPESHRDFQAKHALPFTLLSDRERSVAKAYGAGGFLFPKRKTFLIDENGVIVKIYEHVDVATHGTDIVRDFILSR